MTTLNNTNLLYNPNDSQAYFRAMLKMGYKRTEPFGFGKFKCVDDAGNVSLYNYLTGSIIDVEPGERARKDGLDDGKKFRGVRGDYATLTVYFLHASGVYFNSHQQLNRWAVCIDPVQRGVLRKMMEYARDARNMSLSDVKIASNHSDLDKSNDFAYNIDICINGFNQRHAHIAKRVPKYDDHGNPNYRPIAGLTTLGGDRLRKGIYMSAMVVPEAFGAYLTCGVNGAERPDGEPYSRFMSRVLSDANLPFDIDYITVADKKGNKTEIRVSCRTIHQILADCYMAGAECITGYRSDVMLWDYVFNKGYTNFIPDAISAEDMVKHFAADQDRHSVSSKLMIRLIDFVDKGYFMRFTSDCGDVMQTCAYAKQDLSQVFRVPGHFKLIEVSKSGDAWRTIYDLRRDGNG